MKILHSEKIIVVVLIILSFFQCKESPSNIDVRHQEVMAIHDEVMPKQSALSGAQLEIKKWIARQPNDFQIPEDLNEKYIALQEAEEAMWSWMNQYSKPKAENPEIALQYLEQQKLKISEVRDKMLNSLSDYEKIKLQYEF